MTTSTFQQRLLVSGWIDVLDNVVSRGMPVLAAGGDGVGVVAAVVQNNLTQTTTHILLGQVPPTAVYRLIPTGLLDRLEGDHLWLRATPAQITALPVHQPLC